jgi:hypothetical protein
MLARWLRRTANRASARDRFSRWPEPLLCERVTLVRSELLDLADMLERTEHPDADSVVALRDLLSNGCDSPLYNADLHPSELRAALYYIRLRLDSGGFDTRDVTRVSRNAGHVPPDPR